VSNSDVFEAMGLERVEEPKPKSARWLVVWDAFGRDESTDFDVPDGEDPAELAARIVADQEYAKSIDYLVRLPDDDDGMVRRANDRLCDIKGLERPDYEHCVICRHLDVNRVGFPLCEEHRGA
jgi:hypothetical protein